MAHAYPQRTGAVMMKMCRVRPQPARPWPVMFCYVDARELSSVNARGCARSQHQGKVMKSAHCWPHACNVCENSRPAKLAASSRARVRNTHIWPMAAQHKRRNPAMSAHRNQHSIHRPHNTTATSQMQVNMCHVQHVMQLKLDDHLWCVVPQPNLRTNTMSGP